MATGTNPKKKPAKREISAAEGETQLIPLVEGQPQPSANDDKRQMSDDRGWTAADSQPAARSPQPTATEVPQETVPMPAVAWPPSPSASAEPEEPVKPPPLRRRPTDAPTDPHRKQPEASPRPGLFTGELRRALPPWAYPFLTFQPFSVWLGARIGLTLLAILATLMIPSIAAQGTANWYGSPGGPTLNPLVDSLAGVW